MSDYNQFFDQPQEEKKPPPRSGARVGCYVAIGLVVVVFLAAAIIVAGLVQEASRTVNQAVDSANPANIVNTALAPQTPTIVVRPPAISQVRSLADLTTSSVLMSTIVEAQQARVGKIVYEKLVLLACGKVKAGINLGKLKDSDIVTSDDGVTVTVRLPKAEIFDTYLIDDSTQPCTTRVYDRTNLLLLAETKDLESQAREQAVNALRDTALQSGILSDAERNAQVIIERVLMLAGYKVVIFAEKE
jgi:hypothetical protein